jgi:hypothetical protein
MNPYYEGGGADIEDGRSCYGAYNTVDNTVLWASSFVSLILPYRTAVLQAQ